MSDLFVIIKGLAFCRPVPSAGITQILFPHAPFHSMKVGRAKISNDNELIEDHTDPFSAESNILMEMTLQNGVISLPPPNDGDGNPPVNDLINIGNLHRDYHLSALTFKNRNAELLPFSYLTLPTSTLFSGRHSRVPHEIWSHRRRVLGPPPPPTRTFLTVPTHPTGLLADEIRVRFYIPDQAGPVPAIKLNLQEYSPDPQGFTRLYTFLHEPDPKNPMAATTHIVTFDNHCGTTTCGSDFGYYYEMLLNSLDGDYQVEVEEFPLRPSMGTITGNTEAACNAVIGDTGCDLKDWFLDRIPPTTTCTVP